jgi:hypothetical protein
VTRKRILFLSSVAPSFAHFRAAQTVFAHLLMEMAAGGADVAYAVAMPAPNEDPPTRKQLARVGVEPVPGNAPRLAGGSLPSTRLGRAIRYARESVDWRLTSDKPTFADPQDEVRRLLTWNPDAAILFWDTIYENLLPYLGSSGLDVYGYLARPPFAAGAIFAANRLQGPSRILGTARMAGLERRHVSRLRAIKDARNICAVDAAWYDMHAIPCSYLPNTWPDAFGPAWRERRKTAESARAGIHILGNTGGLNATGNRYGMRYLTDEVLPLLPTRMRGMDWVVNICGRFELPPEFSALKEAPHVALRGFVDDIDEEVAGNQIFLLLNNAGPYSGAYTRVIYAFSSGSCLIAHRRLADSMPELVHGRNCLLGGDPDEIADLIAAAARDSGLRARLGEAGRATYEQDYRPSRIAQGLRDMVA